MGWSEKSKEIKLKVGRLNGWVKFTIYGALIIFLFTLWKQWEGGRAEQARKKEEAEAVALLASGLKKSEEVALVRYTRIVEFLSRYHLEALYLLDELDTLNTRTVEKELLREQKIENAGGQ